MGNLGKFGGVVVIEEKVYSVVLKNLLEAEMVDMFVF